MKTALVIMAAGIGSRFGKGIKQLEPLGPSGELIMDYSIHDALEAGFNKIVFIIRKEMEDYFREVIGDRVSRLAPVEYAFQELDNLPVGFQKGERTKPWGTGQAVLACKGIVNEPFVVINADDYYGKEAFKKIYDFLHTERKKTTPFDFCMAGFKLKNTLSDNGGVPRGLCETDECGLLSKVNETKNIEKVDGKPAINEDGTYRFISGETLCSMNMWGITPDFFPYLEKGFVEFLSSLSADDIKTEYLLPIIVDNMLKKNEVTVTVLDTDDKWFGVTYQEDKDAVKAALADLVKQGVYPENIK